MDEPTGGERFRRNATLAYRAACVGLVVFFLAACALGWHFGAWWGLGGAGLVAGVVSAVGAFGATFVWAMTQDGA